MPGLTANQRACRPQPGHGGSGGIELLAIDLDGTTLRRDKRLSERVCRAVRMATARGVRVVLATARPPRSVRPIRERLGLTNLQVHYNGALVHDPVRRAHVLHRPLQAELARRLVRFARRLDPRVVVSLEILDRWYTDHVDDTLPTETALVFRPDVIGPLEAFLRVPITKLMLLGASERIDRLRDAIAARFGRHIALPVSDPHLLQIVDRHVDKATALALVARRYDVLPARVMAIGDAPNDNGMIRWAGVGVAVANAWPETRHAADVVVPSNDDDGVAEAIERFVLDPEAGAALAADTAGWRERAADLV